MTTSIIGTINAVLQKHGIKDVITDEHITVTDSLVCDFAKPESYLSELLIEKLWPRIHRRKVFHFTTQEAAESIIASRAFRLGNLAKRYGEGELSTFSASHKLEGYMQRDDKGQPVYRTLLMPNTFYASFTDASLSGGDQEPLWRRFSGGDGVRLTFDLEASNPNFRDIRYQAKPGVPIPVLAELSSELMRLHKKHFILSGISRLCAFYLPQADFGAEKECRILYKTWEGVGPQPIGNDSSAYVELPLGTMSEAGYKLELVEVSSRDKPAMPDDLKFSPRK
ncbi:hypothetical protein SNE35_09610 [Paucibacter sp. R3-3]|uniref:DUF2971 domain-containing protein n=1 Tax=Roseateles agri TaxID=3098619 RepID=A0ABU5DGD5_9BURK|nr:hypothetical protein [Paucibacter sp. R3-3]MDY0744765.1 hypothetical protein [Paucibacter sp. R3-3]